MPVSSERSASERPANGLDRRLQFIGDRDRGSRVKRIVMAGHRHELPLEEAAFYKAHGKTSAPDRQLSREVLLADRRIEKSPCPHRFRPEGTPVAMLMGFRRAPFDAPDSGPQ